MANRIKVGQIWKTTDANGVQVTIQINEIYLSKTDGKLNVWIEFNHRIGENPFTRETDIGTNLAEQLLNGWELEV